MKQENKSVTIIHNFLRDNHLDGAVLFMFFTVCLGLYLGWEPIQILVALLTVWMILKGTNGQQVARWSFALFILMSVSIMLKQDAWVERFSFGAMIFLFFSIIKISIENTNVENEK